MSHAIYKPSHGISIAIAKDQDLSVQPVNRLGKTKEPVEPHDRNRAAGKVEKSCKH